jgi:uncharacterized repeat protein (TIGR03803 family)
MKNVSLLFCGLVLISTARLYASNYAYTSLHVFSALSATSPTNNYDGGDPTTGLILVSNVFYGAGRLGGISNSGTIFRLNPDGNGFTTLHNFTNGIDGANPTGAGCLVFSSNALFGVTSFGGTNIPARGTVYRVNADGSGFTNLYSFHGTDGQNPTAGLIISGGTLYGTTHSGGGTGKHGTLFQINADGSGFNTIFAFSGTNGSTPSSPLTLSGNMLYGVTLSGSNGFGSIYRINTDSTAFTNLYNFTNGSDGALPESALVLFSNALYGTTTSGGISNVGTLFRINTDGSGFKAIHEFTSTVDAGEPFGGLTLCNNVFYGTAIAGNSSSTNYGIIFQINPDGSGFTNLYNFSGGSDGAGPGTTLVQDGNTLYGTADLGGSAFSTAGNGTLFALTAPVSLEILPSNSIDNVLWPSPSTGFVLQTNGNLGTTNWGNDGPPSDDGTNRSISISATTGNLFFRLAHP